MRILKAIVGVGCLLASMAQAKQPNVILVVADDLGHGGLHCYGTEWLETPHIDKLCAEGMKFTNGLSPYPTCQPSRMALLSGQYGPRTGGYRVSEGHKGFEEFIKYIVPEKSNLGLDKITIAECFQEAGYTTAMYGKWHVGNNGSGHALHHGFDDAIICTGHYKANATPPIELPEGMSTAEYFTQKGSDFINQAHENDQPFFLYLPYYLIHRPLESRPDYIKHFQKKLQGVELVDKNPDEIPIVAAMTKVLDDCVGSLLEKVSELGIEDNTIVVFTSDNGAYKTSLTGPHRGRKGDTYEGGLKVPYIFKWPGKIKAGSSCDERIIGMDLYPTLLAMAGIDTPESYPLDGVDLTPLLVQDIEALPARQLYCFYPKYAGFSNNKQRWAFSWRNVIYDGDYKLIEYPEYGEYELFNLEDDPLEEENLASKYPEKRQTLTATLHRWLKEIDAPELELNPDYSLN